MILYLQVEPGDDLETCKQIARSIVATLRPVLFGSSPMNERAFTRIKVSFTHQGMEYIGTWENGMPVVKAVTP